MCPVLETYENDYVGDLVEVEVAGRAIESTYHHPFWVVEGENLAERPTPDHVAAAEVHDAVVPGRWVDAGDLVVGDIVLLKDGRRLPVERIHIRSVVDTVYNFLVDDLHNYAVGPDCVLVHNDCLATVIEKHHLLPRAKSLAPFFKRAGLDIEDPQFIVPLQRGIHRLKDFDGIHTGPNNWNAVWKEFFTEFPNAEAPDILQKLAQMREAFGI